MVKKCAHLSKIFGSVGALPLALLVYLGYSLLGADVTLAVPKDFHLGSASGGIAVYYNDTSEGPTNVSYFRAQAHNSMTDVRGAQFAFSTIAPDPNYPTMTPAVIFGSHDNFGFDLIAEFETNTSVVPELHGVDRTPASSGYALDPQDMGPMAWGINDYKPGGVTGPTSAIVNTLIKGIAGEVLSYELEPVQGGWQMTMGGTLRTDNFAYWYGEGIANSPWEASYGVAPYVWFEGTLTYLVADDVTPGMDFYAGTIDFYAVPEPASLLLLVAGAMPLLRRRRQR